MKSLNNGYSGTSYFWPDLLRLSSFRDELHCHGPMGPYLSIIERLNVLCLLPEVLLCLLWF